MRCCSIRTCDCYRFASKEAWFELTFVRTEIANKLAGGFSGLLAGMLLTFFGAEGANMQRSGVALKLADGSHHHVFMKLGSFLADEAALHFGYCNKGASGLKPCVLCANVFNSKVRRDIVEGDATGRAQHHTTHDATKLILHTPESITTILRRLQAAHGNLTVRDFDELQTTMGWTYSPDGVMWNPVIRPIIEPSATATFDWMHIIFVHGVFGVHMGQVMWRLKPEGVTYEKMHDFLQKFNWAKQHSKNCGKSTCIPKRARACWSDVVFKCTASEGLSLIPVISRYFTEFMHQVPAPSIVAKGIVANLMQLVHIVHLILKSSRSSVSPVNLQNAIKDYLHGYKNLHGEDTMIIKFHLLLHLPAHLKKYGFLPNCFVHERKHKGSKKYANHNTNTSSDWDGCLLRDVTCHHLTALQNENHFASEIALLHPYTPSAKVMSALSGQFGPASYLVSKAARTRGGDQVSDGDVVLYHDGANLCAAKIGMLVSAELHGELILVAVMDAYTHVRTTHQNEVWKPAGRMKVCHLGHIEAACVWCVEGDSILTLRPAWME